MHDFITKIKTIIPKQYKRPYKKYKEERFYKGDNVICPICQSKYRLFAIFYLSNSNSRCINCDSLERHRLLWLYLNEKTNFFNRNNIRLLHFAPEEVFYDIFSSNKNIEYFPCDLTPKHYKYKRTTKIIKADMTNLQFDNNYFDVILCNHVLEHIPDDFKAMSELNRVLKEDGWGIFQVPINYKLEKTYEDFSITTKKERAKAFGQHNHVRWYGKDYKERLFNAGFHVNEDSYIKEFSSNDTFKYGLTPNELVYFCTKKK
jgi:SAM-dependent methyltransferase